MSEKKERVVRYLDTDYPCPSCKKRQKRLFWVGRELLPVPWACAVCMAWITARIEGTVKAILEKRKTAKDFAPGVTKGRAKNSTEGKPFI